MHLQCLCFALTHATSTLTPPPSGLNEDHGGCRWLLSVNSEVVRVRFVLLTLFCRLEILSTLKALSVGPQAGGFKGKYWEPIIAWDWSGGAPQHTTRAWSSLSALGSSVKHLSSCAFIGWGWFSPWPSAWLFLAGRMLPLHVHRGFQKPTKK